MYGEFKKCSRFYAPPNICNTVLTHHENFHSQKNLGLPHQDVVSYHQSAIAALTETSAATKQLLGLVQFAVIFEI